MTPPRSSSTLLLRNYITQRLKAYYNQPSHLVVGTTAATAPTTTTTTTTPAPTTPAAIDFGSLWGEHHWMYLYSQLYAKKQGQWLTPVELFQPYYTRCVAEYYLRRTKSNVVSGSGRSDSIGCTGSSDSNSGQQRPSSPSSSSTFDVIEFGGGRGTNAKCFLDYYLDATTTTTTTTTSSGDDRLIMNTYTIVDTSTTLQQLQRLTLHQHLPKTRFVLQDVTDIITDPKSNNHDDDNNDDDDRRTDLCDDIFSTPMTTTVEGGGGGCDDNDSNSHRINHAPALIMAFELLDNLGHDKIRIVRRRRKRNNSSNTNSSSSNNIQDSRLVIEQAEVRIMTTTTTTTTTATAATTHEEGGSEQIQEVFRPLSDPLLVEIVQTLLKIDDSKTNTTRRDRRKKTSSSLLDFLNKNRHDIIINNHSTTQDRDHDILHSHDHDHEDEDEEVLFVSWIPTVAYGLLMQIARRRPNSTIVLADFDSLPPPDLSSSMSSSTSSSSKVTDRRQEPLVTDMNDMDYACYIKAHPHLVDILYPTDFNQLQQFCDYVFNGHSDHNNDSENDTESVTSSSTRSSTSTSSTALTRRYQYDIRVEKQGDFLQRVAPSQVEHTRTGRKGMAGWFTRNMIGLLTQTPGESYSPMVHDFSNCSIITITPVSTSNINNDDNVNKKKSEDRP